MRGVGVNLRPVYRDHPDLHQARLLAFGETARIAGRRRALVAAHPAVHPCQSQPVRSASLAPCSPPSVTHPMGVAATCPEGDRSCRLDATFAAAPRGSARPLLASLT